MTPTQTIREELEHILRGTTEEFTATKAKNALAALADLERHQGPVDENRELADHYLYMGWLGARPDRPWTDEDAREAFLHALKYARAHPPATRLSEEVRGLSVEQVDKILDEVDDWLPGSASGCDFKDLRSRLESLNTDSHGK